MNSNQIINKRVNITVNERNNNIVNQRVNIPVNLNRNNNLVNQRVNRNNNLVNKRNSSTGEYEVEQPMEQTMEQAMEEAIVEQPMEQSVEQSLINNLLNNTISDRTKYHFFIGNIFTNTKQIQELVNLKKNLKKKLKYSYGINEYHSNYQLSTNLIYLGYFTTSIAKEYMSNVFTNLLTALCESPNIKPLICEYLGYKIKDDKKYYKISIEFDDSKNILSKVIIPYLYESGITPVYNKKNYQKPEIDLIYFKKEDMRNKISLSINLPKNKFMLSSLSLIRGLPTKTRSGTPSTHNQMNLEEVSGFTYKFSQ